MSLISDLNTRSSGKCEICTSESELVIHSVPPFNDTLSEHNILLCQKCKMQLDDPESIELNHWRCLNESIWSETDAVKVISYRMLHHLKAEAWPNDLLEMMYLEEDILIWAQKGLNDSESNDKIVHLDSNGAVLENGDTVVLIKDLNVKGANFTAKRGTAVRNISLVFDNAEQIEGKVNGQHIVILTQFVKKNS